jgi:peptide/nickel transport system substrate-binding protein
MILQKQQFGNCIGEKASADAACKAANLAPVGTNAWKLKSFTPGEIVTYERNPHYRGAAQVAFDEVVITGGGDALSAARAACETGNVDYSWNLQLQQTALEPLLAAGKCDPIRGGSFGVERIVVNFANPDPALGDKRSEPDQLHPFLTDLKVRRAISLAIDRQAIAEQVYGTFGAATCNILVVPKEVNSPNTSCDRNLEAAKALLDEAGWIQPEGSFAREKDGKQLVVSLSTSISPLRQGEQAIIKANLEEIGIQVDIKAIGSDVFFGGGPDKPDSLNKMYVDLQMYTNGPTSPDVTDYFAAWICANVNSQANQWNGGNDGRYCSQEFDALYQQYVKELDQAKRTELAIKMNDFLVNDVAIIPLIDRPPPSTKAKNLNGPTFNSFDSLLWNIADWSR